MNLVDGDILAIGALGGRRQKRLEISRRIAGQLGPGYSSNHEGINTARLLNVPLYKTYGSGQDLMNKLGEL